MTTRGLRLALVLAASVGAAGAVACAGRQPSTRPAPATVLATSACTAPMTPMVRNVLYFGLHRRDGTEIADADWEDFLARELTPRFDGLTVYAARGQWMNEAHQVVREPARVVVILHADSAGARQRIEQVIQLYRARFDQESVLWEATPTCAVFRGEPAR